MTATVYPVSDPLARSATASATAARRLEAVINRLHDVLDTLEEAQAQLHQS
jgi:hypothetical protein